MTRSILTSALQQLVQTSENVLQETGTFQFEEARVDFYVDGDRVVEEGALGTDFFRLVSTQGGLIVTKAGKEVSRIESPGSFRRWRACCIFPPGYHHQCWRQRCGKIWFR